MRLKLDWLASGWVVFPGGVEPDLTLMYTSNLCGRFNRRVLTSALTATITTALASTRSTNDSARSYVLVYLAWHNWLSFTYE